MNKRVQDTKEKFSKDTESPSPPKKKTKTNLSSGNEKNFSQIKSSFESLSSRLNQVEDSISGLADKEDILTHIIKKYKQNMQEFCDHLKRPKL
jgi:predicted  nucleic acid-binding Zn-ribbon protein